MAQKYSLVPDGSLYSDATIFRMKTAIDDNHAQACVGIPATVRGIRYVDTKTLFIVYGLNQTPKCKRLTQLLDKKFSNSYYCETMYQGSKMCQLNNAEGLFRH